jgi:hypothetical protein
MLDQAMDDHIKAMSRNCGGLVRMPTWCQLGYFTAIAFAAGTAFLGVAAPALRRMHGEITTRGGVIQATVRVLAAIAVTVYIIHSYHAAPSAPYHVPCF